MGQLLRARGLPSATALKKTLAKPTPDLPSSVTGVVRIAGLVSAAMMLKIFPVYYYLIDENGDYITNEDGNRIETIM